MKSSIKDININGVDIREAFKLIGDEEVIEAMMKTYCEDGDNKLKAIQDALDGRDLKEYAVHVHALKSSSKALGAVRLSERFKELELAAKRGDAIYVKGGNEAAINEYKRILGEMKAFMSGVVEEEDSEGLRKEDLKGLSEAIKSRDAQRCLQELKPLKSKECSSFIAGSLEDIEAAVSIKDFEDAGAILEDVLLTMEVSGL